MTLMQCTHQMSLGQGHPVPKHQLLLGQNAINDHPVYHDFTEHNCLSLVAPNGKGVYMLAASLALDAATLHPEYRSIILYCSQDNYLNFKPVIRNFNHVVWVDEDGVSVHQLTKLDDYLDINKKTLLVVQSSHEIPEALFVKFDVIQVQPKTEAQDRDSICESSDNAEPGHFVYQGIPLVVRPSELLLSCFHG